MYPLARKCPSCGFERFPEVRKVKKGKKWWVIYTCPMCKLKDIDDYIPLRLWNGREFADEQPDN